MHQIHNVLDHQLVPEKPVDINTPKLTGNMQTIANKAMTSAREIEIQQLIAQRTMTTFIEGMLVTFASVCFSGFQFLYVTRWFADALGFNRVNI